MSELDGPGTAVKWLDRLIVLTFAIVAAWEVKDGHIARSVAWVCLGVALVRNPRAIGREGTRAMMLKAGLVVVGGALMWWSPRG
jgi:hypothetical protein